MKTQKAMIVAGVMSGTSADGVDVALVRITPTKDAAKPRLKLLSHTEFAYPKKLREAVLASMDAPAMSTAEFARLHWRLGEFYGDCITQAQEQSGIRAKLAGVHGQTIYHQGTVAKFLGEPLRCTLQIGEASEVSTRTGLPVVSDFRPADMVAGGQAAPLVPMFDRVFFAHAKRNRVLQNLGGIANMTAIPTGTDKLLAFDSGPASMVIDACMQQLFGKSYDRNGVTAKRGSVIHEVLINALKLPYFHLPAPKSCGREEFGKTYVERFIAACRQHNAKDEDVIATATALTAESILAAYRSIVWPFLGQNAPLAQSTDYIVAGGGAKNVTLMKMLRNGLEPLGVTVSTTDDFGVPSQAKEAMAFALLAWLRWHELPGNVPSATGATRPAILGRITLP
ncbi:anhydro-N-acetylmuramic acid kinase [Terriglobus roseus]|uniref:Anhydro-N-acetylmuramic acid kinase n=1 Tax=Terriglobus roseus TaxID=392734 RepID=A0A1G7HPM7_9BACT|nr:anhydro-N-acetylmuramic acid kinase [Terriglobus roseus]SDF02437.1 anhydro-N-acetylmuramic acid kinase [Terriglobus roseus]